MRGGFGAIVIKLVSAALGFAVSVLLARILGAEGYGVYAYVFSLTMLFVVPSRFGLTSLVLRETAKAEAVENWSLMRGLWRWTDRTVGVFSLVMILIGGVCLLTFGGDMQESVVRTGIWGLVLIPAIALLNIRGATLQGLRRVIIGQLPEFVLRPGFLLLGLFFIALIGNISMLTPERAMQIHVAAAIGSFLAASFMLHRVRPPALRMRPLPSYDQSRWRRSALPLALAEGARILHMQIGIIVLGLLHPADQVGLYQVATQLSIFVSFFLGPVGLTMAPHIARFYQKHECRNVRKIVYWGAVVSAGSAAIIAGIFLLIGDRLIGIIFGAEYIAVYPAFALLCINHLVISAFGPVGSVLNMTGNEKINLHAAIYGTISAVAFCLILIPEHGIIGASISYILSSITVLIYSVYALYYKTDVMDVPK